MLTPNPSAFRLMPEGDTCGSFRASDFTPDKRPMKHPHPLILSKAQKDRAIVVSLFNPINGQTLACVESARFDLGKYRNSLVGRPIPEHMLSRVALVWSEPRRDSEGAYYALFSIPMPQEPAAIARATGNQ